MLKTPMSAINEICMRHNAIPHYNVVVSTTKEYTCKLTFCSDFNDIEAVGKSGSKRGAKHSAAYEALKLILLETGVGENVSFEMENIQSPCADETKENFMKKLKIICEINMLPVPEYVTVNVEGVNLKKYTVQCRVSSIATEASGFSKKYAKQHAADDMIRTISCLRKYNLMIPVDFDFNGDIFGRKILEGAENEDKENCYRTARRSFKAMLNYSKTNISDYNLIMELEDEYFFLNHAVSQKIEMLGDTSLAALNDPESVIDDISKTSQVQFLFNRIDRVRQNGGNTPTVYVALKSITPSPLIVFGKGTNEPEARQDASRKMLILLKDMIVNEQ